jgi:carnitine O-acetyltransferase
VQENARLQPLPPYEEATDRAWVSDWQLRKAAWVVRRFAELRTKLQK